MEFSTQISPKELLELIESTREKRNIPYQSRANWRRLDDSIHCSINKAEVHMVLKDNRLEVVYASNNIKNIMGYTPEELEGKDILDYRANTLDKDILREVIKQLNSGETVVKTNTIINKNGEQVKVRGIIYKDLDKYIEIVWRVGIEFDLG